MKVKIFDLKSAFAVKTKLEDEINVWLENNPNIEIVDQKTNSSTIGFANGHLEEIYTVCIFYKK